MARFIAMQEFRVYFDLYCNMKYNRMFSHPNRQRLGGIFKELFQN